MMSKLRFLLVIASLCLGLGKVSAEVPNPMEEASIDFEGSQVRASRMMARLADAEGEQAAEGIFQAAGVKVINRIGIVPGLVVLEINDLAGGRASLDQAGAAKTLRGKLDALRDSGLFTYVVPDLAVKVDATPTDAAFTDGTLWGLRNIGQNGGVAGADISAVAAWDITTGDTNVIVAVVDTGVRYTHQDLRKQMWVDASVTNRVVYGTNAVAGTLDPMDDNGHGTHCSGTIGASANDGAPHVGVAWKLRIMACKCLGRSGSGSLSDIAACVSYAVSKGAKVINLSLGWVGYDPGVFDVLNAARTKGVLIIAAAGNSAEDNDVNPHYPASYKLDNIVSVAALDRTDSLADFSNYGATSVHVGAPGVDIFSCWSTSDSSYNTISGTSMATPHVVGVAALLFSRYTNSNYLEIRERILNGVDLIPALTLNTVMGGRVNAKRSLSLNADGLLEVSVSPPGESTLLANSTNVFSLRVADAIGVTNATATAFVGGQSVISFKNDGKTPDLVSGDALYTGNYIVPGTTGIIAMTFIVTAPGKTNSTNTLNYTIVPRPPNDNMTNANKIAATGTTSVILSNNKLASTEEGEPSHAGVTSAAASLWWNFSPAVSGKVFVDTSGSTFDTLVGVYTGTAVGSLTHVGSVDDVGEKLQGYMWFDGVAGATYRIAVAGYDTNAIGTIRLRVEPNGNPDLTPPAVSMSYPLAGSVLTNRTVKLTGTVVDPAPNASGVSAVQVQANSESVPVGAVVTNGTWSVTVILKEGVNDMQISAVDFAKNWSETLHVSVTFHATDPVNDFLVSATLLRGASGTNIVSTVKATKEYQEPMHAGNEGGHSAWWTWTAPANGALQLTTTNSTFDTLLAVYTGNRVGSLVNVGSNDDAFDGSGFSKLTVSVVAGETYQIAVDGYGGTSGTAALAFSFTPAALYNVTVTGNTGGTVTPSSSGLVASNTVVRLVAAPEANYQFVGWEGSVTSTNNPLEVTVTKDLTITGKFAPLPFTDGFESGGLAGLGWTSSGNAPWTVQTNKVYFGKFAARSGVIGNSQTSSLLVSADFAGGTASFEYRASSEEGFDELVFLLDGQELGRWSGDTGWKKFEFTVAAGSHQMEWRYEKDFTGSAGEDAAYLDNLLVPVALPSITAQPMAVEAVAGEMVMFSVTATGNAPLTYRWQKNGVNLEDGGKVSGSATAMLHLDNVSTNEAGTYGCVVTGPGGSVASATAKLSLVSPPTITAGPQSQTLFTGVTAILHVDASGSDLTYQWKKGGSDIAGATAATLTISNVKVTDAGEYTVVVKNRAGSVTATATLTVSEAPPTIRLAATVSEGAPVLQISVEGTVPASATVLGSQDLVTWTTVGTVTFEGSSATFRDLGTAEIPFRFYKVSVP